ncbi:MAG: helicase [Nitrospira sp. HN-bin3]|uniref:DEAD/DEAH box helicase n=1 Tax=Nitrospira cf. moscoviensis SBR1015 TaxID=96242 RepID=UPI000A0B0976|nr:DEAD/DEAH box helicase [Nitrospira cf. moscoviensis SBR1015]OQW45408.1 MAG: helicase [Nitrospira sp. HN-bin3]
MNTDGLTLCLTPHGHLVLRPTNGGSELDAGGAERIKVAFARGPGHGLLWLGAAEVGTVLPPVFAYWRQFGARFMTALCTRPAAEEGSEVQPPAPPTDSERRSLAAAAPVMPGAEYLTAEVLHALWGQLGEALVIELAESGTALPNFLKAVGPAWHLVGRVHFNLAENRRDEEAPFAFLATYTSRLSAHGKAQHLPLGQALREYAGAVNKERLLSLLLPVQRAAERCTWLKQMVDAGELFHPLRWSVTEAVRFLSDVHELEQAGVVVRMPATWRAGRPSRPHVRGTVGTKTPAGLGKDALLDFQVEITLDGQTLTPAELKALLASTSGLALIRGQWVEIDHERLVRTMHRFQETERLAQEGGLTFAEAMRMLSGADISGGESARIDQDWSRVDAGPWLAEVLKGLRSPDGLAKVAPGRELHGQLRPYQQTGLQWLHLLSQLGLGACLADDMGLGKTLQVISLLLVQRDPSGTRPSLLVAPASLLANWSAELSRFAPTLKTLVAHPSAIPADRLTAIGPAERVDADLVITSYGSLLRVPWLQTTSWRLVIIDEAQAIKNPDAKQTRAVKQLPAQARIALTGTPIENRLSDLWSIFDFINPGLLGSAKEFASYAKRLASSTGNPYGPLRDLVRPYVLRRLKTDKTVIADLPEKTEVKAFCPLTKKQAALYQEAVKELREQLEVIDGMKRRGVVLTFLMRFKQICNHPSQWLGDGAWTEDDSGKWGRLREISEVIAAKQEKVLVFTQFREVTAPLAAFLGGVFGRSGLVLHGGTEVKKRRELVQQFQEDEAVPFFVLSLKAGGAGLNLTAASHVVHFDRWWNPAVENQATDRAFRIGQEKAVLVHKFVCKGTVEEKIDWLIESKRQLSTDLLEGSAELNLTELDDKELLDLVRLDLRAAMKE